MYVLSNNPSLNSELKKKCPPCILEDIWMAQLPITAATTTSSPFTAVVSLKVVQTTMYLVFIQQTN